MDCGIRSVQGNLMTIDHIWIRIGKITREIALYESQVKRLKEELEKLYILVDHVKVDKKEEVDICQDQG